VGRSWIWLLAISGCFSPNPPDFPTQQDDARSVDSPTDPTDGSQPPDGPVALGPWDTPTPIPGVNSTASETDPSLTADRLTICFTSSRVAGQGEDIYIGTRATTADPFTVSALAIVNSTASERSCEISPDGNTIFFTSTRSGMGDVYTSTKVGGAFVAPTLVTELNTTAVENDIALSPDGATAMLMRSGDLYLMSHGGSGFSAPMLHMELDVTGNVAAPTITNNANAVYFHAGTVRDLYVAYRQGNTFSAPVPIAELNTTARDAAPFISADERYLAFEKAGELFEATR
jgi:hypothetical protein